MAAYQLRERFAEAVRREAELFIHTAVHVIKAVDVNLSLITRVDSRDSFIFRPSFCTVSSGGGRDVPAGLC